MGATEKAQDILRHPLQRLESPSRGFSAFLHIISSASFAYSFRYLVVNPNPINDSYGWHMQYLTILGLTLAAVTMAFGLLADITLSRHLFFIKNVFSLISAPMEVLITVLYWGLRSIDISLVLPPWAPRLSLHTDMSFHFLPAFFLLIDVLILSPPPTLPPLGTLALSSTIAISYWYWVETCYQHNGFYPYPIFDEAGYHGRIALFAGSAAVMTIVGVVLGFVYGWVNGTMQGLRRQERKAQ